MSEETEVKQDKEWLKGLINEEGIVVDTYMLGRIDEQYWKNENIKINKGRLFYLIDQLDGTEVLTQEWIDKHAKAVTYDGIPDQTEIVYVDDLKELLVSNKKEIDQAYKDGYDKGIELMEVMMMEYEDGEFWENEKMKKCIEWLKEVEYSNRKDLEE